MSSCNKVLEEQPRADFTPTFFQTEAGVQGGITALYASLRYVYGQAYYYNINTTSTDEATYGESADNNFKDADLSGVGTLNASSSRSDVLWGVAYTYINTASGIIENAEKVNAQEKIIPESLIAEARFFRAFYYFQLVQTFGGVPLDLGSGELKFNSTPVRTSVRNTVPEVYTAIFNDLETAVANLPETPRVTGGVTKNVARLVLAKANLTYGWWIENPKNIPTYPAVTSRGTNASSYFTKALNLCKEAISNPGNYGLCDTFREVSAYGNDRNKEIMLWADHTEKSSIYNGYDPDGWGGGGAPENFAGWMINWNHGTMKINGVSVVQREDCQYVGRPWTRMCPTLDAIKVFTDGDITKDSRWDGTFVTSYYGNWNKGGDATPSVPGADGSALKPGDCVLVYEPFVVDGIDYSVNGGGIGAGKAPEKPYYVIDINGISRIKFPALWKLIGEKSNKGTGLGSPNAGSSRPFNILKFSDFYLTAAEAAFKLNQKGDAKDYINVLRKRAGKWSYNNRDRVDVSADYGKDLTDATPSEITLDYILDERMREFYGDGFRWFDLVRTQTWKDRAGVYHVNGGTKPVWTEVGLQTINRTIEDYMYLRPIPQGQLDGMEMTQEEKDKYQNPGYPTK